MLDCTLISVYIFTSDTTIIKYTIVIANKLKNSWLHVSAALQPSSGQLTQIKHLQCAYSMGSHSVYNYCICVIQTIVKNMYLWIKYVINDFT